MNESQKWPDNKDAFDMNYFRLFGFCNAKNCPRSWHCYRASRGFDINNRTWVPIPDDYDKCEWFVKDEKDED